LDKYQAKIIDILIIEGKKTLGKITKGKKDDISFSTFISDVNYFLTTLDLWLLVEKYKIPTIFISQKCILQTKYEKHAFLAYGKEDDDFVFILLPGFNEKTKPNYKVIQNNNGEIFISSRYLTCIEYINEIIQNKISFEEHLIDFTKQATTNYQVKTKCKETDIVNQKSKLIVEDDEESVEKPKTHTKKEKTSPAKQGIRKRCPNGMVRNEQGDCVDKNKLAKATKLIVEDDEPAEKVKKVTKAKKIIVEDDEEQAKKVKTQTKKQKTSPAKQGTRKRCPNGMVRNSLGDCVDKNKLAKATKLIVEDDEEPAEKVKKVTKAKKIIVEGDEEPVEKPKTQTKKQKTSPAKQGTRKRCPNGMVRNSLGECVDKNKVEK